MKKNTNEGMIGWKIEMKMIFLGVMTPSVGHPLHSQPFSGIELCTTEIEQRTNANKRVNSKRKTSENLVVSAISKPLN